MPTDLDDGTTLFTSRASTQEAMSKPSPMRAMETKRLRSGLRDGNMKPIVCAIRVMKLAINSTDLTFVLPDPNEG